MDIWQHIEDLKAAKRWTDKDLCDRLGNDSKSNLYNWRKGLSAPRPRTAEHLADLLIQERVIQPEKKAHAICALLGVAA